MFIDIHCHSYLWHTCPHLETGTDCLSTPDHLVKRYDAVGIEKGVLLPVCTVENVITPQCNEEIMYIAEKYPGRFIPFCNLDPRALYNTPYSPLDKILAYYKSKGCKGIGEVTANLPILDPRVQNLFHAAEVNDMPLTFHLAPKQGGLYGLVDEARLPGLEISMQRFPNLKFFGHSQTFWCEISSDYKLADRYGYPKGKVTEGAIPRLMRKYPNLYGDLSAGSGCNALTRDKEYAIKFLNEFQDRLLFGTDICAPATPTPLVDFLLELRNNKEISETVFQKVARENAVRLLHLD